MNLSETLYTAIELEARKAYPEEFCGLILEDVSLVVLPNEAEDKTKSFNFNRGFLSLYGDKISYIIHSHTSKGFFHVCTPSAKDIIAQHELNLPFLICGMEKTNFTPPLEYPPKRRQKYVDRPFIMGINDCGTLVQDFYLYEFEVMIKNNLLSKADNRKTYPEHLKEEFARNDFVEVKDWNKETLVFGDILLSSTCGTRGNHTSIFIDRSRILNQSMISAYEPLENLFNSIEKVYRHASLC